MFDPTICGRSQGDTPQVRLPADPAAGHDRLPRGASRVAAATGVVRGLLVHIAGTGIKFRFLTVILITTYGDKDYDVVFI